MTMPPAEHKWTTDVAIALCAASRWSSGTSLLLTLMAIVPGMLLASRNASLGMAATLMIVLGAVQLALAVRIEFDCRIFGAVAARGDMLSENFANFDSALRELRLRDSLPRSSLERAAGTLRIAKASYWLLACQFAVAATMIWLAR